MLGDEKLYETIERQLERSNQLRLRTSRLDPQIQHKFKIALDTILRRYGREDLSEIATTITRELVVNALKANQKRLFFQQQELDLHNPEDYKKGIERFKHEMSSFADSVFTGLYRQMGLYIQLQLRHSAEELQISVENNASVTREEAASLESLLTESRKYDDLAEFYLARADEHEGAGLGLAMIVILLKAAGHDEAKLHYDHRPNSTCASVTLPLR